VSLAPYVYGRDRQLVGLTPTERLNEISVDGAEGAPAGHRIPRLERGASAQPSTTATTACSALGACL